MAAIAKMKLVAALCDPLNRTLEAAALAAGVSARTARRWRQEPDFLRQLERAQADIVDDLTGRLMGALPKAEGVYLQTMLDKRNSPMVRLRAADGLVNLALRLHELRNLERRLAALEGDYGGAA